MVASLLGKFQYSMDSIVEYYRNNLPSPGIILWRQMWKCAKNEPSSLVNTLLDKRICDDVSKLHQSNSSSADISYIWFPYHSDSQLRTHITTGSPWLHTTVSMATHHSLYGTGDSIACIKNNLLPWPSNAFELSTATSAS